MSDEVSTNEDGPIMNRGYADTVIGGQAGSEGKGAIVAHLLRTEDYAASVRPGSSNAGHTVYDADGEPVVHQVIPSAATIDPTTKLYMAAESSFGLGELLEEYERACEYWGQDTIDQRLRIDPKAAVITDEHRHTEAEKKLGSDIGSTVHGCGAVRVEKIWRSAGDVKLAEDYRSLDRWRMGRISESITEHGANDESVLVEGTQGTMLSMNQSPHWPFTTSRDCTASAMLSSSGIPPAASRDVWAVFRTYPIRVGGHSGPLDGDEIDFDTIADRAGHDTPPVEFTSVTKKKRRIFEWSWAQFQRAIGLNDPDYIAITFADYINADDYGVETWGGLSQDTRKFVEKVQEKANDLNGAKVAAIKTGPRPEHTIDLRTWNHSVTGDGPRCVRGNSNLPGNPGDYDDLDGDDWFDLHPAGGVLYHDSPRDHDHPHGSAGPTDRLKHRRDEPAGDLEVVRDQETAEALESVFPTVGDLAEAFRREVSNIDGVSAGDAARIKALVGGQ